MAFLVLDTDVVIFIITDFPDSFVSILITWNIYFFCIASQKREKCDSGSYKSTYVNLFFKLRTFERTLL